MTPEEKEEIINEIINRITTKSVSVNEVDTVTDTSIISTLPCLTNDGTVVKLSVSTLAQPSLAAASKANTAAENANASAAAADTAKSDIEDAYGDISERSNQAISDCENATEAALTASANIGNKKILVITEDEYNTLLNGETIAIDGVEHELNDSTIYFCKEVA